MVEVSVASGMDTGKVLRVSGVGEALRRVSTDGGYVLVRMGELPPLVLWVEAGGAIAYRALQDGGYGHFERTPVFNTFWFLERLGLERIEGHTSSRLPVRVLRRYLLGYGARSTVERYLVSKMTRRTRRGRPRPRTIPMGERKMRIDSHHESERIARLPTDRIRRLVVAMERPLWALECREQHSYSADVRVIHP